jgi:putative membrane protein
MPDTSSLILSGLSRGVPILLLDFGATLVLLGIGVAIYRAITPFNERDLIAQGNTAAGLVFAGSVVSLAIPLAATLATSEVLLDILIWGLIALILQLATFVLATLFIHDLRRQIDAGNVAAGCQLVAAQLAVALLNAAAVSG